MNRYICKQAGKAVGTSRALAQLASSSCLPFCRNWNTAVATSTLSGFLSGCHSRRRVRHSFMRWSLDSTSFSLRSFSRASAFALSTSGFVGSFGSLLELLLLLEELFERLLALPFALASLLLPPSALADLGRDRLLLFPDLRELRLLLLLEELLFLEERSLELLRPPPASTWRTALEPACGEKVLRGAAAGEGATGAAWYSSSMC
mmetsp:Transcript_33866/g.79184  ORF Transcript_33866/g.79184 Transcript_33866/m.79184 type:complete len:205 (+) Transcript_33866:18-632(+)